MIEDHIMDGDFVVCEQTQVANPGEIVVALVNNDEATLKRIFIAKARGRFGCSLRIRRCRRLLWRRTM
jgi:SOS-response transcriptional repressor LexA